MQVRVVSSNVQVLVVFPQQLTVKGHSSFLFLSLNPLSLPCSFSMFPIVILHIFFLSSSFCDFVYVVTLHICSVSLLGCLNSDNNNVEIVGS